MDTSKSKCNFCRYFTGRSCMATPNSIYCREAIDEYYQYLKSRNTNRPPQKSLRSWDKNKLN